MSRAREGRSETLRGKILTPPIPRVPIQRRMSGEGPTPCQPRKNTWPSSSSWSSAAGQIVRGQETARVSGIVEAERRAAAARSRGAATAERDGRRRARTRRVPRRLSMRGSMRRSRTAPPGSVRRFSSSVAQLGFLRVEIPLKRPGKCLPHLFEGKARGPFPRSGRWARANPSARPPGCSAGRACPGSPGGSTHAEGWPVRVVIWALPMSLRPSRPVISYSPAEPKQSGLCRSPCRDALIFPVMPSSASPARSTRAMNSYTSLFLAPPIRVPLPSLESATE